MLTPVRNAIEIEDLSGDSDCGTGGVDYGVRVEPREIHGLAIVSDDAALTQVAQVSQINETA